MYTRSLNRGSCRIAFGIILLAFSWQPAAALSTDQQQSIVIEADTGELDDTNNVSTYTGDVVVTQGSIRMTGEKMTVYFTDSADMESIIMEGQPATYRQLPDDSEVYDEGQALRMEYYENKDLVILIDQALVTQEGSRFSGNRIENDTRLSKIKVTSKPSAEAGSGDKATGDDRVRIIIQPQQP